MTDHAELREALQRWSNELIPVAELPTFGTDVIERSYDLLADFDRVTRERDELTQYKSLQDDFMAYMTGELARLPCCHDDGSHKDTPPMMWPELIACIAEKHAQTAVQALLKGSES